LSSSGSDSEVARSGVEINPSGVAPAIDFTFSFPLLDITTDGRKVEHEVLPTSSTDTGTTVVQPLGEGKTTARLRGSATRTEAQALDDIEGDTASLTHPRLSAEVFVSGVNTRSQEARRNGKKIYSFDMDLIVLSADDSTDEATDI
jgi:hypothetical protein